jgi:chromosome partitioning protein|tara:strand:+ start:802 stop:1566 length:765 start_codon:yes stop_codon:yes gene_type:complete
MTTTITVTNVKGGVGKSTTSLFIANILANEGKTVLLMDIDSQNSLTSFYFEDYDSITGHTILEALTSKIDITDCLYTVSDTLHFIPSDIELCNLASQLKDNTGLKLNSILKDIKSNYDYIIIDTPPNLHMETRQSLAISNYVIIPTLLEKWAVRSIDIVMNYLNSADNKELQEYANVELENVFILPTSKEKNRKVQDIVLNDLKDKYEGVLEGISRKADVQKLSYIGSDMDLTKIPSYKEYQEALNMILSSELA